MSNINEKETSNLPVKAKVTPASEITPSYWKKGESNISYYHNYYTSYEKIFPLIIELDKITSEKLEDRAVVILEKLRGVPVKVTVKGSEIKYGNRYTEIKDKLETFGAIQLFKEYEDRIKELESEIKIPFSLYGELVGNEIKSDITYFTSISKKEIIFHDVYLNENWLNWDDFSKFLSNIGLPIVPCLGLVNFEEEKIEKFKEKNSIFSEVTDQIMEGIVIRPFIEDEDYSKRLIAKITNSKFIYKGYYNSLKNVTAKVQTEPETVKKLLDMNNPTLAKVEAKKILSLFINQARFIYFKHELEIRKVEIKDENFHKILSVLVQSCIKDLVSEIDNSSKVLRIDKKILIKELRRELPKMILEGLNLKIPKKEI